MVFDGLPIEIIKSKCASLNENARNIILHQQRQSSYKSEQQRFIKWANINKVPIKNFITQLINFLSVMHTIQNCSYTTLKYYRAAVMHLQDSPTKFHINRSLLIFFKTLANMAPPVKLHRPLIDLTLTFLYLKSINHQQASFHELQSELVFLFAVICFFRPSDLSHIPLSSITLSNNNQELYLEVHCPKERKRSRRIIKSFIIKAHSILTLQ